MPNSKDPERVWHYFMDAEGHLWHEGTEFDDPDLLNFFMKNLEQLPDGRYHVLCQGEECYIQCEDVPYVVQDLEWGDPKELPALVFQGGYHERLDPSTLWVGKGNVLYCKVRDGKFDARFNRKSYIELTNWVQYDRPKKTYCLMIDGVPYPIKNS